MPVIGQNSQGALGLGRNCSMKSGLRASNRLRAAFTKRMFFWAAVSVALFVFFVLPCSAAKEPQEKEKKEWTGRPKYGKKLYLEDLEEWSAVLPGGKKVYLKDLKEWSAELKSGYSIIDGDLDALTELAKELGETIQELEQGIEDEKKNVIPSGSLLSWQGILKDGKKISNKETNQQTALLKRFTTIEEMNCRSGMFLLSDKILGFRRGIGINELEIILKKHLLWLKSPDDPYSDRACFRSADLREVRLYRQNLQKAVLSFANLKGADISQANLEEALLDSTYMKGAHLKGANMKGADLENANLESANLEGAILEGANLNKVAIKDANLVGANLKGVQMRGVDLVNANLEGANLENTDLRKNNCKFANFKGANLKGANLEGANLQIVNFEGANLKGANLWGANMEGARLEGASLEGANLWQVKLMELNLIGANLSGIKMEGHNLSGAKLIGAVLNGTDFRKSDLSNVYLMNADMSYVVFENLIDLPCASNMLGAKNLWKMVFTEHSKCLIEMKEKFKNEGMPAYARQVSHASKHNKGGVSWHSHLTYWFLEFPSNWGESPLMPILFFTISVGLFSVFYWPAFTGNEEYAVFRVDKNNETRFQPNDYAVIGYALLFSFICALRFGWRGVGKGTWLTDAMPKELLLKPVGWCRAVCGLQSVISKYMILLFLANYFGGLFRD